MSTTTTNRHPLELEIAAQAQRSAAARNDLEAALQPGRTRVALQDIAITSGRQMKQVRTRAADAVPALQRAAQEHAQFAQELGTIAAATSTIATSTTAMDTAAAQAQLQDAVAAFNTADAAARAERADAARAAKASRLQALGLPADAICSFAFLDNAERIYAEHDGRITILHANTDGSVAYSPLPDEDSDDDDDPTPDPEPTPPTTTPEPTTDAAAQLEQLAAARTTTPITDPTARLEQLEQERSDANRALEVARSATYPRGSQRPIWEVRGRAQVRKRAEAGHVAIAGSTNLPPAYRGTLDDLADALLRLSTTDELHRMPLTAQVLEHYRAINTAAVAALRSTRIEAQALRSATPEPAPAAAATCQQVEGDALRCWTHDAPMVGDTGRCKRSDRDRYTDRYRDRRGLGARVWCSGSGDDDGGDDDDRPVRKQSNRQLQLQSAPTDDLRAEAQRALNSVRVARRKPTTTDPELEQLDDAELAAIARGARAEIAAWLPRVEATVDRVTVPMEDGVYVRTQQPQQLQGRGAVAHARAGLAHARTAYTTARKCREHCKRAEFGPAADALEAANNELQLAHADCKAARALLKNPDASHSLAHAEVVLQRTMEYVDAQVDYLAEGVDILKRAMNALGTEQPWTPIVIDGGLE